MQHMYSVPDITTMAGVCCLLAAPRMNWFTNGRSTPLCRFIRLDCILHE